MIQKFEFEELPLKGSYKITPFLATDERGGLLKDYNVDIFNSNGIKHNLKENVLYNYQKRRDKGITFPAYQASGKAYKVYIGSCIRSYM